jgi:hypothetical protein
MVRSLSDIGFEDYNNSEIYFSKEIRTIQIQLFTD